MKLPRGWKSRESWNGVELVHGDLIVGAIGPWSSDHRLLEAHAYAHGKAIFNDEDRAIDWLVATATRILEGRPEPRTIGALDLPPDAQIGSDLSARVHLTAEQRQEAARLLRVGRAEARRLGILNSSIERDIAHREMTSSLFEGDSPEETSRKRAVGQRVDRVSHGTWDEFVTGPRRWTPVDDDDDLGVDEDLLDSPADLAAYTAREADRQARFTRELQARLTPQQLEHWAKLERGELQQDIAAWLGVSRPRVAQLEKSLRALVDAAHVAAFGRPYPFLGKRRAGARTYKVRDEIGISVEGQLVPDPQEIP